MNWGWKIAIFLTLFIGFIMSMVIYSFTTTADLVAEDYYNQEIQYQLSIDAQKNALELSKEVSLNASENTITIKFPESFNLNVEKGDISFYRPENAKLDRSFEFDLNENNEQEINKNQLAKGSYKVTIQFISEGKTYLFDKEIWV